MSKSMCKRKLLFRSQPLAATRLSDPGCYLQTRSPACSAFLRSLSAQLLVITSTRPCCWSLPKPSAKLPDLQGGERGL